MKVMSFNVLCWGDEAHDIEIRKEKVVAIIKKYHPDTFGLQEAHIEWMNCVREGLPEYDFVGVGREDGKEAGEFSPVFFLRDKYEVIDKGNFWLSETPEKPGKGWDAACVRICSYAVLKDKESGKTFTHFNTHLDHVGEIAQIEGAKIIAERGMSYPEYPAFFTGDFNVLPESEPYNTVINSGYKDARNIAADSDDGYTFNAFDLKKDDCAYHKIIDYIFVKDCKVNSFKVITDKVDGQFASDHYPVIADIDF
ncbi:MAG: endonuclease/exonuclease/phosphatase family protein [Ruminococcus sp.]|nr:endonuclease/exonuclease/phosphatase family protein [Candidatus Copronaster equi]